MRWFRHPAKNMAITVIRAAILTGDHLSTCDGAAEGVPFVIVRVHNTELEERVLGIVS